MSLSKRETATFRRDVADSLESGRELTISGDDWTLPFSYREPIEVAVESPNRNERELEIEIEFAEPRDGGELGVE